VIAIACTIDAMFAAREVWNSRSLASDNRYRPQAPASRRPRRGQPLSRNGWPRSISKPCWRSSPRVACHQPDLQQAADILKTHVLARAAIPDDGVPAGAIAFPTGCRGFREPPAKSAGWARCRAQNEEIFRLAPRLKESRLTQMRDEGGLTSCPRPGADSIPAIAEGDAKKTKPRYRGALLGFAASRWACPFVI